MNPPKEPSIEDCCNSGCNPCIYDVYEKQLKIYNKIMKDGDAPPTEAENGISQLDYTTFEVVGILILCQSQKLLLFKTAHSSGRKVWWRPGDHFLFKYNADGVACTRAYTPIKLKSHYNEDYDFSIVIKRYKDGLVSNYMFDLAKGDLTFWRGPYGSYKIRANTFDRIIMIAQGTGLAPLITIIENTLDNEDDMTKIFLFYCCQSEEEILFRNELYLWKSYWNFTYEIFVTCSSSDINVQYQEPIIHRRFKCDDLENLIPFSNDQCLICGSSQFTNSYEDFLKKYDSLAENIIIF